MLRTILSVVAGVAVWCAIVVPADFAMQQLWPAYALVHKTMAFDPSMQIARLVESTAALVIAAIVTARLARGSAAAPWILGVVFLAIFIPIHYTLWDKFPIWYHAYFLASLLLVSGLVGSLALSRPAASHV